MYLRRLINCRNKTLRNSPEEKCKECLTDDEVILNFVNEFKAGLKTGNGMIQTGTGIISPIS